MMRPMTSLRDVDEGGIIRKGSWDRQPQGQAACSSTAQVIAIMDTIRYGTADAGEKE